MQSILSHYSAFSLILSLLLTGGSFLLTGCGNDSSKPKATQVAAKVGSDEITVHQINQVLSRLPDIASLDPKSASRDVLEKLIDQQLTVQQATEAKLHRTPEVVAQVEAARQDILSRAYLQQVVASVSTPAADEVRAYYKANPALFSERRVFDVKEVLITGSELTQAQPGLREELRQQLQSGASLDAIVTWLTSKKVLFNTGSAVRAAEEIPLAALPVVHALQDGQATLLESGLGITLVHVVSSKRAPVSERDAAPRIEQFLIQQRKNEAVAARVKALRTATTVEYLGEFAQNILLPTQKAAPAITKETLEKGVSGIQH